MTSEQQMDQNPNHKLWISFALQVSLVIAIFVTGLYYGVYVRDSNLLKKQIESSAKAHFQNIVLTRSWNAIHGGVYVEKKGKVESNPYLVNPDITSTDGRIFTKRNPALMTREISELADKQGLFTYHITSLTPLNPSNVPDIFEQESLKAFENGVAETTTEARQGDTVYFRYMAPLMVKESCMQCHGGQGYAVGDVRGGISVSIDITEIEKTLSHNRIILIGLITISTVLVLGALLLFTLRLMRRLNVALKKIATQAITDELTGVYNRRHFFERLQEEAERAIRYDTDLTLIKIDLDYFKQINDTFGHQVGDVILREVASILRGSVRGSDIIARYGGEEFTILIPNMKTDQAALLAEKLRKTMEHHLFDSERSKLKVTISCGVSDLSEMHGTPEQCQHTLLQTADKRMYMAKAAGRNQVVSTSD